MKRIKKILRIFGFLYCPRCDNMNYPNTYLEGGLIPDQVDYCSKCGYEIKREIEDLL